MCYVLVQENKPLYSFEDNGDYVYDVAWSPIHPAVFATVDGMGRLDVWNLNQDTEVTKLRSIFLVSNSSVHLEILSFFLVGTSY